MKITYEEMKKRIFGLDVLATSYDERNKPIGARKLPTVVTVCMQRIRNEYAPEIKICNQLILENIKEHVQFDENGPITEINDKGLDIYVYKSDESREQYKRRNLEIMAIETKSSDHQVSECDILRMDFLEEWVYAGVQWMIKPTSEA